MRPWLSRLLNVGNIPGLHWIDKKKKIFRIPWKHGSSQNWTPNDANLFVKWAEHTGKYSFNKPNLIIVISITRKRKCGRVSL